MERSEAQSGEYLRCIVATERVTRRSKRTRDQVLAAARLLPTDFAGDTTRVHVRSRQQLPRKRQEPSSVGAMQPGPKVTPGDCADLPATEVGHPPLDLSGPGLFRIGISLIVETLEKPASQLCALVCTEPGSFLVEAFHHSGHRRHSNGFSLLAGMVPSPGSGSV
jgi:hypothetical protein